MTTSAGAEVLQFYPERYYSASPTYNTWVKLTAAAVHRLRPAPSQADRAISRTDNFDVHPTFFHLNHPIRFVRLVGTVVAVEDIGPRFVLLTLDDGSGATLELKVTRLSPAESALHAAATAIAPAATTTTTTTTSSSSSSASIFHTTVDNLVVRSAIGVFEVLVNGIPVDIGTTIKAKATLGTFRGAVQGVLQRCWVLRGGASGASGGSGSGSGSGSGGSFFSSSSTRDEAAEWLGTATFMLSVLAKPWVLSADDIRRLERRLAREEKQRRDEERRAERKRAERARRKEEVYRERREKVRVYEERVERRRRQEEVLMNKGALV